MDDYDFPADRYHISIYLKFRSSNDYVLYTLLTLITRLLNKLTLTIDY